MLELFGTMRSLINVSIEDDGRFGETRHLLEDLVGKCRVS
jgi:hypothetical protein